MKNNYFHTLIIRSFAIWCLLVAVNSDAAVVFIDAYSVTGEAPNGSIQVRSGLASGDLMLTQIVVNNSNSSGFTAPSGWLPLGSVVQDGSLRLYHYYKISNGTEVGQTYTWQFSNSGSGPYIIGLHVYRGVDQVNPFDGVASVTGMSGSNIVAPSVTTTTNNSVLIGTFAVQRNGSQFTPPGGMSEIYDVRENSGSNDGVAMMTANQVLGVAGATGAKSATVSNASNLSAVGSLMALSGAPVTAPLLIGSWSLDETTWSGAADEVVDTSGNSLNGRAVAVNGLPGQGTLLDSPALSGNPGTCGYGVFSGANSGYLIIDDPGNNSPLDLATELTVTSWIYPRSYPRSGLMSIVSKDENFEYHLNTNGTVNWWWGGGSNEMNSTTAVPLNTWSHVAIVYQDGSQQIYINGVLAGTHSDTGTLTTQNDPLFIGTDLGFNSRSFDGYIDEVRVYDGAMTQAEVNALYSERHACTPIGPDHYSVMHSGSGVTCEAAAITITAHDASHSAVVNSGTTITLSSSLANNGWTLINGSGTLSGNQYTFATGESSVQLGLIKTTPATLDIDISDGIATDLDGDASEDAAITFSDVGFVFYGNGVADSISHQLAGKASNVAPGAQLITLKAVQTNQTTGRCDALINATAVDIGMDYECINPGSCALPPGTGMTVSGTALNGFANGGAAGYQNVSLNFDASGEASVSLFYPDAGQTRLYARANLPVGGVTKTVSGSSNAFVWKPAGFCVEATESNSDCSGGNGVNCSVFKRAGDTFDLQITAKAWGSAGEQNTDFCDNTTTPNFQYANLLLGNRLDGSLAGSAASLSVATADISANGTVTVAQSVDNVGNFYFSVDDLADYLGAGPVQGSESALVGRFVPYAFNILSRPLVLPNDGYAYLGQPFMAQFDVSALNKSGVVTTNYQGDLALAQQGDLTFGIRNNANAAISSLDSRITVDNSGMVWSGGVADGSRQLALNRNGLEGPFERLQVGVSIEDQEGSFVISGHVGFAPRIDTDLDGVPEKYYLGELNARLGRLYSADAWGPEAAALNVPFRVEYWDGSLWRAATGDGTAISRNSIVFTSSAGSAAAMTTDPVTAPVGSNPTVGFANDPTGSPILRFGDATATATGDALMVVGAPGVVGYFTLDVDLTAYPWLRFDWNQDGDYNNDTALPTATIRFETYRGNDRVIYWKETLE